MGCRNQDRQVAPNFGGSPAYCTVGNLSLVIAQTLQHNLRSQVATSKMGDILQIAVVNHICFSEWIGALQGPTGPYSVVFVISKTDLQMNPEKR